jgi:hypothetical protein
MVIAALKIRLVVGDFRQTTAWRTIGKWRAAFNTWPSAAGPVAAQLEPALARGQRLRKDPDGVGIASSPPCSCNRAGDRDPGD